MEQKTLKITNVLSDPTRFSIYQYICKRHNDVTVQEIAEYFGIHANVARLHLTKLEDVKMLVSDTKKTGKGGRPSRYYRLSDEVISLQFPFRDYRALAEICLHSLLEFGDEGLKVLNKIAYKFGQETAESYVLRTGINLEALTNDEKLEHIAIISRNQGLNSEIQYNSDDRKASFTIYNCIFKELLKDYADSLCTIHRSMLLGIFEYFLGNVKLEGDEMIATGCDRCSYTTVF